MEHWLASSDLDTRDVVTAVEDFLLAGVDTSAYAASFLLYNLARSPKAQDRCLCLSKPLIHIPLHCTVHD